MGDNTEMGTLAVTEELHAKQQEAARKEAERAARKAPQPRAAQHISSPLVRLIRATLPAPQLILDLAPRPCEPSGAGRRRARRPVSNP
jgi:hypothetical protein